LDSCKRKPAVLILCFCFAVILLVAARCQAADTSGQVVALPDKAEEPDKRVDINSIVYLTFRHNPEVVSARYSLKAAEFQFKDFQRNLSQFTPLLLRTNVQREDYAPQEEQKYYLRAGMEKEFFNGARIFGGVGHKGEFGDTGGGTEQFVEADVRFPLFGSNTTLRRITDRSREENEMLNARLEYVDTIRDNIQDAQLEYIWLMVSQQQLRRLSACIEDYEKLLNIDLVKSNSVESRQIEGEIQQLKADVTQREEWTKRTLLALQLMIGLDELSISEVAELDLYAKDYYGKRYAGRKMENLLEDAHKNDVKIRVLRNARQNSIEKKRLADEGKWDVFVDFSTNYDMQAEGNFTNRDGYLVFLGLEVKKIDPTLLDYSRNRAIAEIQEYEALIREQRLKTRHQIELQWLFANNRRERYDQLSENIKSRRKVYQQKRKAYLERRDSLDNLINARNELLWVQEDLNRCLGGFYESITFLDHACGVYFDKLQINI